MRSKPKMAKYDIKTVFKKSMHFWFYINIKQIIAIFINLLTIGFIKILKTNT